LIKAKANADNAYELGARVRGREEAGKARERGLERKVMQLEEDLKMADAAIKEYAALVRGMEAKLSSSESGNSNGDAKNDASQIIAATLAESKLSRERLLHQFQADSELLHLQLENTAAKLDKTTAQLEAESSGNEAVRSELGRVRTELEKLQLEDGTAAKMVSRYMCVHFLLSGNSQFKRISLGNFPKLPRTTSFQRYPPSKPDTKARYPHLHRKILLSHHSFDHPRSKTSVFEVHLMNSAEKYSKRATVVGGKSPCA
jgi:hypothetical protein